MRTLHTLIAIALAASAHADPQLTSWFTTGSGKYARQYTTAANRTAGTTATTWTGHTNPAYSDVYEVSYSASWVYVKYTGLPSYAIGPWFQPDGVTPGTIMPATQSVIRRFPRTPTVPAVTAKSSTAAGTSGILVNGVHIFNNLDGQAWSGTAIVGGAQHTNGTYYWHRVAPVAESYNFDYGLAHSNPGGAYHNHQNPIALRYQLGDHVDYNSSTKNYSENAAAVTTHSPILGYAHDGYPVYGPYGYSTATDASSGLRRMVSGYVKRNGGTTGVDTVTSATTTMPAWYLRYRTNHALGGTTNPVSVARSTNTTTYPIGTFAQDYSYLGDLIKTGSTPYAQGTDFDLDEYNGRFCYTPEYPTGTYAYFVTIDSGSAAVFPYVVNFEHYGATTLPLTLTSIVESVTSQVVAGPAKPVVFTTTPSASGGNVTLTWNSVEGSSYTVENSTNQTSWTTRSTGLAAATNATTTAQSIATIGSSGTEYGRVTRTALATYDVPTTATAVTTAQTATGTYNAGANTAPTLTTISALTGAVKNTAFSISYATLAAAADEADANGDAISFRIEAVSSGTLTKNSVAVTAGSTLISSGDTVVWTPATNALGTLAAFTVKAYDGALASSTAVTVNVVVTNANNAPTLTTISTLTGATEDTAFSISYATLAAAADEADADGDAISFRIEAVSSGTLTKGGVAVTAASTLISSGDTVVWTPAANASGTLAAFTVKAYDGITTSSTAVTVNVTAAAVNDAPTLTTLSTLSGAVLNTPFNITYTTLAAASNIADVDGTTPSFRIEAVSAGTLTKSGAAVTAGSTLISSGDTVVWTPATGYTGTTAAFSVKAYDGALASSTAVDVNITVALTAADSQLTSWATSRTGRYARIVETDATLLSDTTETTWTRTSGPNTIAQTSPVYAGPQQVDYSASWVYLRTPSLGTYTMGPWYNDATRSNSALFLNICKNQGLIVKIPRSSTLAAAPATKTQTAGYMLGGVIQGGVGYYVDGVALFDSTDGFSYASGSETSPGTGQWHRDAWQNEQPTFDKSYAHQQNTGFYHNHANPIALRYQLGDAVTFNSTTKVYSETMTPTAHSPIIGWMLDGLPVYGPYGYSTATDASSGVRRMVSGFVLRNGTTTGVDNLTTAGRTVPAWSLRNGATSVAGPAVSTTYPLGRYVEDNAYLGDLIKTGTTHYALGTDFDLNEYNVRYCVTPEFPGGTYAYFLNLTSTGTPTFPYMVGRWFYGTPTGGTITTISETVTNQFTGGANRPLAITSAAAASPNVTLTWNAVEGGTYSVDASANNSTWTSKATGLTVTNANTKTNTHATLGTTGTEYARVNRTALATYDSTGTVAATTAQTTSTSFLLGGNVAPTLTTVSTLTGASEDTTFSIPYATLAAAANEADANGDAISFRIEAVSGGVLTLGGENVTPGTTLFTAGDTLAWYGAANANGTLAAFTVKAWDGALASATAVQVNINVAAVNDAPTLTTINALANGTEDTVYNITYSAVAAAANEADADGDAISFRVEETFSGTLTKNGATVTAGTLLSSGDTFVWTPPGNANGFYTAMTVTAYDGALSSGTAMAVQANLVSVNDTPTLTDVNNLLGVVEDTSFTIPYATLFALTNAQDADGDALSFRIQTVTSGTLTKDGVAITPSTTLLSAGESLVWTPAANAFGYNTVCTFVAYDGALASSPAVNLSAVITAVNDAPTLTTINTIIGATEDTPFTISYATLATSANEADVDGDALSFLVSGLSSGTLTKNGVAAVAGTTLLSVGESFVWTPPANGFGSKTAFFVKAYDGIAASNPGVAVTVTITGVADGPIWTGNENSLWSDANNWIDFVLPLSTDTVQFGTASSYAVNLDGSRTAGGLTFSGDSAYTLSGNTLTLGNAATLTTSNPTSGTLTHIIASAVSLGTSATANISASAGLTLSGAISGVGALTKTGAGTLTISGTHTRSGGTTVSAGTLSMSSATLADAANVSIASGAILNLNYSGTDTIAALTLGGVKQYAGTHGSLTSSATYKTARITGSGILNVTVSNLLFTEWATLNGLDGTAGKEAGQLDDPDKDGIANALEFVLGGNPLANAASILPTATVSGGTLTLTFTRTDESEYSVAANLQTSSDLATWTTIPIPTTSSTVGGVIFTIAENGTAADTITAQIPIGTNTKIFARLAAAVN